MSRSSRTAIVLSGGGSRGAYEAGVIRYILDDLPKVLGHPVDFEILTGTSVGAINACFLAATMEQPERQGTILCDLWRSLRLEELIGLSGLDMLRAGRLLLGRDPPPPKPGEYRYGGLLDTTGLEKFVLDAVRWGRIRINLRAGRLQALAVSATHVGTGHTTVFIDSAEKVPDAWSRDPFVNHRIAAIGPRHALASAAIPMLFPAVRLGRSFYVDGGLRQNTPMSPAIRLGADRMLVISLRHMSPDLPDPVLTKEREIAYPKPLFLFGKALNALLLDRTEYDIERMQRLNEILEAGTRAFGSEFQQILNDELIKLHGAPIRRLHVVHVRPSVQIGGLAARFVEEGRVSVKGRVAKRLVARLADSEARHESDVLSYVLFDGEFAGALVDLGYRDASAMESELATLFSRESLG